MALYYILLAVITLRQDEVGAAGSSPGSGGEVRIVAPLGAPRSPASSPTMTAPLAPLPGAGPMDRAAGGGGLPTGAGVGGALGNNLAMTTSETTTHLEERTSRLGYF